MRVCMYLVRGRKCDRRKLLQLMRHICPCPRCVWSWAVGPRSEAVRLVAAPLVQRQENRTALVGGMTLLFAGTETRDPPKAKRFRCGKNTWRIELVVTSASTSATGTGFVDPFEIEHDRV